jgi:L-seryl-tRNA(Ser) seleniumtransferase
MTDTRSGLPAVHKLLAEAEQAGLTDHAPREVVVDAIRDTIDDARRQAGSSPEEGWVAAIQRRVEARQRPSLAPVINATGVVLHTNLGRAPLAEVAHQAVVRTAGYNTLEYDVDAGERGSRQDHLRQLLTDVTGAEDALVVTNAAAAMVLVLNAVAAGGETIVSRGELVEIGGSFRIPDILEKSGTVLIEVGTTNRTKLQDYLGAVSPRTRCVLKVHRSNFRLSGFVTDVETGELVDAMAPKGVPVVHDVGSGLLVDLSEYGLTGEPRVQEVVAAGATVVFSGDKLLGGPQAGIIVGSTDVIRQAAANPFTRAMRPGKTVIAALEATLRLYRDRSAALTEIPTLAMLTVDPAVLHDRAEALAARVDGAVILPSTSSVGGGSFPDAEMATTVVCVPTDHPDRFMALLRRHDPPVIARASEDGVLLDPRTIQAGEEDTVVQAMTVARKA